MQWHILEVAVKGGAYLVEKDTIVRQFITALSWAPQILEALIWAAGSIKELSDMDFLDPNTFSRLKQNMLDASHAQELNQLKIDDELTQSLEDSGEIDKKIDSVKFDLQANVADVTDPSKTLVEKEKALSDMAEAAANLAGLNAKKGALEVKGDSEDIKDKLRKLLVKGIHQASKFWENMN